MKQVQKVVWTEGMFLRPHHFQQFEKYLTHYSYSLSRAQQGYFWGFFSLEIDQAALRQGTIALNSACGIMPDGTYFYFDKAENGPAVLKIEENKNFSTIVLAIPLLRPGRREVTFSSSDNPLARYHAYEKEVDDFNSMSVGSAMVQFGQLRLQLMPENELTGDWAAIRVLRIQEKLSDNSLKLDPLYIPPMLCCQQNENLRSYITDILGLLRQRSQQMSLRLSQTGRTGVSEIADFLLLQLINRYLGHIHHVHSLPQLHPERLFAEWLKLACDLDTFSPQRTVTHTLPVYDHDDLAISFNALMLKLRQGLSIVFEENAIELTLIERSHGLNISPIHDSQLIRDFGFVLAVKADLAVDILRTHFPAQMKIAPVNNIRDLVQLQLPGITLRSMPAAPRQIPYHAGYIYFELEKSGELWKYMESSGAFALHLAGDFPGLDMKFWAIRNQSV